MFARKSFMHLNPKGVGEFIRKMEKEIIPLLRKQGGFLDAISFVDHRGTEAFGITLWDRAESAEAYNRGAYPKVMESLATVIEGPIQIETYEVSNSTFHNIAAPVAPERHLQPQPRDLGDC